MKASDRTKRTGAPAPEPRPSAALRRSTGRDRGEWFALLDEWGAGGRAYREIADWLVGEHGVSSWWAQKLIVEYEQARIAGRGCPTRRHVRGGREQDGGRPGRAPLPVLRRRRSS